MTTSPDLATTRALLRVSLELWLESALVMASLFGGDLTKAVIWLTVLHHSASTLQRNEPEWEAYVQSGRVLPDEKRRPLSVYAIANTLQLPFETTRRHVLAMSEAGQLQRVKGGIVTPAVFLSSAPVRAAGNEVLVRLRRSVTRLVDLGLVEVDQPPGAWLTPAAAEVGGDAVDHASLRAIRPMVGFIARGATLIAEFVEKSFLQGLLLVGIGQANLYHAIKGTELAQYYLTRDEPVPDAQRRPIRMLRLADSLGIPFETARRNISRLVALGLVERRPDGVIMPEAAMMDPRLLQYAGRMVELYGDTIAALERAGMEIRMSPALAAACGRQV